MLRATKKLSLLWVIAQASITFAERSAIFPLIRPKMAGRHESCCRCPSELVTWACAILLDCYSLNAWIYATTLLQIRGYDFSYFARRDSPAAECLRWRDNDAGSITLRYSTGRCRGAIGSIQPSTSCWGYWFGLPLLPPDGRDVASRRRPIDSSLHELPSRFVEPSPNACSRPRELSHGTGAGVESSS